MSKYGVLVLHPNNKLPIPLKKASLLFDKIYISETPLKSHFKKFIKNPEIEFLVKQSILLGFNDLEIIKDIKPNEQTGELIRVLNNKINNLTSETIFNFIDIVSRLKALILSLHLNENFFPLLYTSKGFVECDKKAEVVQFVLKNIPEPDENTPWEQIIDFRSDEDTRLKYLALINWVNEIAKSNYTIGEIKDKYEYLYLDYKRSYKRHKMKSGLGTLEILTAASIGFLSSDIPTALTAASHLFKVGTSTLNLLKEEGNIPGKEIAYIYKAKKTFNKS